MQLRLNKLLAKNANRGEKRISERIGYVKRWTKGDGIIKKIG